jgi:hypothetical protein
LRRSVCFGVIYMRRILFFKFIHFCLKLKFEAFLSRNIILLSFIHQIECLLSTIDWLETSRIVVSLESLVQIVYLTLLLNDCALSTMLLLVDLFNLFLPLNLLCSRNNLRASVHASRHHLRVIRKSFILSHLLFMNEMVGCSYSVVTIGFNALDSIIAFEPMLILH